MSSKPATRIGTRATAAFTDTRGAITHAAAGREAATTTREGAGSRAQAIKAMGRQRGGVDGGDAVSADSNKAQGAIAGSKRVMTVGSKAVGGDSAISASQVEPPSEPPSLKLPDVTCGEKEVVVRQKVCSCVCMHASDTARAHMQHDRASPPCEMTAAVAAAVATRERNPSSATVS